MDQRTLPEGFFAKEAVDLILGAFVLEAQRNPRQAEEDLGYLDSLPEPEFAAGALSDNYRTQTILKLLVELSERPLETLLES